MLIHAIRKLHLSVVLFHFVSILFIMKTVVGPSRPALTLTNSNCKVDIIRLFHLTELALLDGTRNKSFILFLVFSKGFCRQTKESIWETNKVCPGCFLLTSRIYRETNKKSTTSKDSLFNSQIKVSWYIFCIDIHESYKSFL